MLKGTPAHQARGTSFCNRLCQKFSRLYLPSFFVLFLFWRKSVGGQNLLAPSCGERAKVVWCQDQFQPLPHSWYFRRGIGALGTQSFPENWTLFRAHPKSESSKNWRPKTRNPNWHRCSPPRQTVALVRQKRRGARKNDIWPALGPPLSAVTYYFRAGVRSVARLFHKGGSREQTVLFKYQASCLGFVFSPECPKCKTIWNISIFLKTVIENR